MNSPRRSRLERIARIMCELFGHRTGPDTMCRRCYQPTLAAPTQDPTP